MLNTIANTTTSNMAEWLLYYNNTEEASLSAVALTENNVCFRLKK
uniref:Uncharacterized protein n=1 Tax=Anguilla anguilla TaxID=7936 RepID=A0A0E9VWF4_ANGAN